MLPRILPVLVLVLALAAVPVAQAQSRASCYRYRGAEKEFARVTNAARARHGIAKLRLDPHLSRVARKNTALMVDRRGLYHTPSGTLAWRVTGWKRLGENIAYGGSVKQIQRAFVNSQGHRANIMGRGYKHFGFGTIKKNGHLWVTVVFSGVTNPGTRLSMPRC